MEIDDTGSIEGMYAFIYCTTYYRCLTDGQTLKDRATQLLIKYKSGALVTQYALQVTNTHNIDTNVYNTVLIL